ncbi:phage terminase large subunit [bacterium]|nr:phage terminase large subunit [bacterium]
MDVNFSKVYKPLFQLLEAWNIIEGSDFPDLPQEDQDYWNALAKVDTVLISGGRDSGKTFVVSCWNPIAAVQYNHRVLYTRQTMSSTDNSITEALENRMELVGLADRFTAANKIYSVNNGDGKISITGQKTSVGTQTAKLKSLEGFSVFQTEEGEELESYDSWVKIKRSIRATDVQCLSMIIFNPPTKEHWIYEEFFEGESVVEGFNGVKDNILYIHSTYEDNIDNLADHNRKEYEKLKFDYDYFEGLTKEEKEFCSVTIKKNWKQYKHVVLGGFLDVAEGVIYEYWEYGEFDNSLPYGYGLDFGSKDPDSLVKVAVDNKLKKLYIKEELYKNNLSTSQLAALIKPITKNKLVIADSASPRTINDLEEKRVNIEGARKGAGSIIEGIKVIQDYTIIVDPSSKNLVKELNNYIWVDRRGGVPIDKWNHLLDATRYYVSKITRVENDVFL